MIRTILTTTGLLALAALSTSSLHAQDRKPVSTIKGTVGVSLSTNTTYVLSIPFATVEAEGAITSVSGATLGVNTTHTASTLTNHSIRILSRTNQAEAGAYGRTVRITNNGTNDVTTAQTITPSIGDSFVIVQNHTLSSLLGSLGTLKIQGGNTPSLADAVYVESGGVFTGYWHRTGNGWRLLTDTAGTGADQGAVMVEYNKGILIARKSFGGTKTVTMSGEAITGRFSPSTTSNQINLVNNAFTVATTLAGSGVDKFISKGATVSLADNIYVSTPTGLVGVWYKTGIGWRLLSDTGGTGADQGSLALTPGLGLMTRDRATGGTGISIEQPFV
ncbi:MAG: hypothetical protein JNG86_01730, partial [Verrucomicrobiaceae bacterium]|nr:hypothetical protein [Verrucomicrobiaceae bacterium]